MRVLRCFLIMGMIAALAVPAWAANDFSSDGRVKALWNMESGALTTDSKGTNTLTDNNTCGVSTTYYKQGAASLDLNRAESESLSITDASLDSGFPLKSGESNTDFTIMFWFRPHRESCDILGKWDAANNKRSIGIRQSSRFIYVDFGHTNGTAAQTITGPRYSATVNWYGVGVSYDDSTKAYKILLVDSNGEVLDYDYGTLTNNISVTDAAWRIGGTEDADNYYDGNIDEVVVLDAALNRHNMMAYFKQIWDYGTGHSPTTWYVSDGGAGNKDGTSAANAFDDGLYGFYVPAESGGVCAGDTVYYIGDFPQITYFQYSGSQGSTITIRNDASGNAGAFVSSTKYDTATNWTGPDAFGAYYVTWSTADTGLVLEDLDTRLIKEDSDPDATWAAGSYYINTTSDRLYYKPTSGAASDHNVYVSSKDVSSMRIEGAYLTFKNIRARAAMTSDMCIQIYSGSHDLTFTGGSIMHSKGGLYTENNSDAYNITIEDMDISYVGNGIYFRASASEILGHRNWEIKNNTISYINYYGYYSVTDAHAIGCQGGRTISIHDNEIHHAGGSGITVYTYDNQRADDYLIYNNFIWEVDNNGGVPGYNERGIEFNATNANDPENYLRNKVYNNIISECDGEGLRSKASRDTGDTPTWQWYNNVIHNCGVGFEMTNSMDGDPYVYFKNNIVVGCTKTIDVIFGAESKAYTTLDNNLYFDSGGSYDFDWDGTTYTSLSAYQSASGQDANSPAPADPLFTNFCGSFDKKTDFMLQSTSPAKGKGTTVPGMGDDSFGNSYLIPSIGAHEVGR